MRRALAAPAAMALCLLAAACSRGSAASTAPPPPACASEQRPAVALTILLARRPTPAQARCLGRRYLNVIAPDLGWSGLAAAVHAVDTGTRVWETRSLQYGFTPCIGCPRPAMDPTVVRRDHPEWILHDAAGQDVHPPGHDDWVMFDISNPEYLAAWASATVKELGTDGWTGVVAVDAGNRAAWTTTPIDPSTGRLMTEPAHGRYLAGALATVKAGLNVEGGFALAADNGPPTEIHPGQIGSADAVSVGRGFAHLTGGAWTQLYRYFHTALGKRVSPWLWDEGPLSHRQRVFGLASYLLVSGKLYPGYGVNPAGDQTLYSVDPGVADEPAPVAQGGAYVRTFSAGVVAVNPGEVPVTITPRAGGAQVVVPAQGAVIEAHGRVVTTG